MKVAVHAGQLLQPVPGGIGRYEAALLPRLGVAGVETVAFGAGPRPAKLARAVPWIDLGQPRGAVRYELWHRLGRPRVRLDADLVHAPSLAIPPVGDMPLVVTVHDIAFLRLPHVSTTRGVRFHRRGLALARRHADLDHRAVDVHPRRARTRRLRTGTAAGRAVGRRPTRPA